MGCLHLSPVELEPSGVFAGFLVRPSKNRHVRLNMMTLSRSSQRTFPNMLTGRAYLSGSRQVRMRHLRMRCGQSLLTRDMPMTVSAKKEGSLRRSYCVIGKAKNF